MRGRTRETVSNMAQGIRVFWNGHGNYLAFIDDEVWAVNGFTGDSALHGHRTEVPLPSEAKEILLSEVTHRGQMAIMAVVNRNDP